MFIEIEEGICLNLQHVGAIKEIISEADDNLVDIIAVLPQELENMTVTARRNRVKTKPDGIVIWSQLNEQEAKALLDWIFEKTNILQPKDAEWREYL